MKARTGFVSNSSSSSFVLGKVYMTAEQIKKFSDFLEEYLKDIETRPNETFISESDLYFLGSISQHDEKVMAFLKEIGVDEKYVGTE